MAHGVGSLRRTDLVAIEGIADILRSLAARRSDANGPTAVISQGDIPHCGEPPTDPRQSVMLSLSG